MEKKKKKKSEWENKRKIPRGKKIDDGRRLCRLSAEFICPVSAFNVCQGWPLVDRLPPQGRSRLLPVARSFPLGPAHGVRLIPDVLPSVAKKEKTKEIIENWKKSKIFCAEFRDLFGYKIPRFDDCFFHSFICRGVEQVFSRASELDCVSNGRRAGYLGGSIVGRLFTPRWKKRARKI